MATRIPVPLSSNPYEVIVGSGLLPQAGELVRTAIETHWEEVAKIRDRHLEELARAKYPPSESGGWEFGSFTVIRDANTRPRRKVVIVSDSNVAPLYADTLRASLESVNFETMLAVVPAGETSKSLSALETVCDAMIAAGLDRTSLLVALGGGVVGDLAGFAAAVYFRGIPYVQIPTTVVAQVDSSVGGKTGVNAKGGKNLIGSFHQPKLVIADIDTLSTLPPREYNEGFAEIIKHAMIRDAEMLDELNGDLEKLIARNVAIKAAIVVEDEFEIKDVRALLNFGHTIGHGIENAAGYGRYLHGEAISLGLAAALRLSVLKAGLPEADERKVRDLLKKYHLPLKLDDDISTEAVFDALMKDKKFARGHIKFVLSAMLGSAFVSSDVLPDDIRGAIEFLRNDS